MDFKSENLNNVEILLQKCKTIIIILTSTDIFFIGKYTYILAYIGFLPNLRTLSLFFNTKLIENGLIKIKTDERFSLFYLFKIFI